MIVAELVTLSALVSGVAAITSVGDLGHWSSIQWTTWRVGLQAVAFLLTMLALFDMR